MVNTFNLNKIKKDIHQIRIILGVIYEQDVNNIDLTDHFSKAIFTILKGNEVIQNINLLDSLFSNVRSVEIGILERWKDNSWRFSSEIISEEGGLENFYYDFLPRSVTDKFPFCELGKLSNVKIRYAEAVEVNVDNGKMQTGKITKNFEFFSGKKKQQNIKDDFFRNEPPELSKEDNNKEEKDDFFRKDDIVAPEKDPFFENTNRSNNKANNNEDFSFGNEIKKDPFLIIINCFTIKIFKNNGRK